VLRAIREFNYHPNWMARSLRTKQTKTVGMIVADIGNPFFATVVRGAEDLFNQEGYTLLIGNSDNDPVKEESYHRTFVVKRVDGLLMVISPAPRPPEYLRRNDQVKQPIVFIDRWYTGLGGDAVLADNLGGSYEAVSHLIKSGHRRIGVITGPLLMSNARLRLKGYKMALAEHGLKIERDLVREGQFDASSGYEQAKVLLSLRSRPTALFSSNAQMTMGCLRALRDLGVRCPEELALVSFDDMEFFTLTRPQITAVAQPGYDLGATAAELLLRRLSGRATKSPRRIVLKTELRVRESCPLNKCL
jgi:LacI family transcriptional regulator